MNGPFQGGVFAPPPQGNIPGSSGYQGMPAYQTLPQQPQGYSYDTSQLPPPAGPPPQGGWPQGTGVPGTPAVPYWTPPQQQPQAYVPQQQQQAPPGMVAPMQRPGAPPVAYIDDNTVLQGPNVPPELQGQTWGRARQLYSAMSTAWLRGQNQQPQQPVQQQRPSQQQQPAGTATSPASFWQNPQDAISQSVQQAVQQTVMPMLQPVIQQTQAQAALQAREVAKSGIRDYAELEPEIMSIVASANPQSLQSPETWMAAADIARGRRMRLGATPPPVRQQQHIPAYQFFTEGPTAPSVPGAYGQQPTRQPTADEIWHAQKWNMPVDQFMAWKYGQPQMQAQPAYGGGGW